MSRNIAPLENNNMYEPQFSRKKKTHTLTHYVLQAEIQSNRHREPVVTAERVVSYNNVGYNDVDATFI